MGESSREKILVVDDDPSVLRALQRCLRRDFEVIPARSGEEALSILERQDLLVIVSDYSMAGMDGVTLLTEVRGRWPDVQRIMLTGQADFLAIERAVNRSGVHRFLTKPWSTAHLKATIQSCLASFRILQQNRQYAALLAESNERLLELNQSLEAKVEARAMDLRHAKELWERTFDALGAPLLVVEASFRVRAANRAAQRGRDLMGRACHQAFMGRDKPCDGCPALEVFHKGREARAEVRGSKGEQVFQAWAFPYSQAEDESMAVCYYQDITAERELQRVLFQNEKMAALGRMAGEVAHEINNPLGGIMAFAQILMRQWAPGDPNREPIDTIYECAMRCKRFVESLLRFTRSSGPDDWGVTGINDVVEEAMVLVSCHCRYKEASFAWVRGEGLPAIAGNANRLQQVVVNLLENALAVLVPGGKVTVTTRQGPVGWLELVVEDDGPGIAEADQSRIFEPFFTTREQGTGLGLSICYNVMQEHGGHIRVHSVAGQGARFVVSLPVGGGHETL